MQFLFVMPYCFWGVILYSKHDLLDTNASISDDSSLLDDILNMTSAVTEPTTIELTTVATKNTSKSEYLVQV
jgi:hypothetical protein